MQTTITPTAERSLTIVRRRVQRPHYASRHPAAYAKASTSQPTSGESIRSSVADAFRKMAHGVGAATAEDQTKTFYRSGGQDWARSLVNVDSRELKSRVVHAFRQMAHGVQGTSAHTSTLRFYRSGGQAWAQNLG